MAEIDAFESHEEKLLDENRLFDAVLKTEKEHHEAQTVASTKDVTDAKV